MVDILGIKIYDKTIKDAVDLVKQECAADKGFNNYCVSATGAHGIVYARQDAGFKEILNKFYLNLPDGMPNVWVGRLKGAKEMKRCYGPEFFATLMKSTASTPIKHFLCGGKEGVADNLKISCHNKFGNDNIVGTYCPPFRQMTDEEMQDLARKIEESGADIVWIGISTPKQEKFAWRLRDFVKTHFIIAVGAAFDFHTDNLKKTPVWIGKIGMEWFYRMMMEPKRLFKRYAEIVPKFIFYNIQEFFSVNKKSYAK